MHINPPLPTPKYSTFKHGSKKRKCNNSGNNKLSNTNTDKPSKLKNTRKVLKLKPKPKATLTTTIALSRTIYATITRVAPLKK